MNINLASKVVAAVGRRNMSSTAKVWVDKNTRVICQGFTGKQVGAGSLGAAITINPMVHDACMLQTVG